MLVTSGGESEFYLEKTAKSEIALSNSILCFDFQRTVGVNVLYNLFQSVDFY